MVAGSSVDRRTIESLRELQRTYFHPLELRADQTLCPAEDAQKVSSYLVSSISLGDDSAVELTIQKSKEAIKNQTDQVRFFILFLLPPLSTSLLLPSFLRFSLSSVIYSLPGISPLPLPLSFSPLFPLFLSLSSPPFSLSLPLSLSSRHG